MWFLTSCLNPKVDLALRGMCDGVATELHIRADKRKQEGESGMCANPECFALKVCKWKKS